MEVVLDAAGIALLEILQPDRMIFLVFGVCIGLMIGILPGMSGIAGMALLIPFTYGMEPITAIAFLLGLGYQFAAAGSVVYRKAKEQGIGNDLPTDWFTEDVHP